MPRPHRQKQARLAFTPLPSSSPAAHGLPQQIQNRAATVSIEDSSRPSKKHKAQSSSSQRHQHILPTPEASGELDRAKNRSSSTRDKRSSKERHVKQRALDFSRSRDPSSFDPPITLPSSSHAPTSSSGIFNKRGRLKGVVVDSSDEESDTASVQHVVSSPRVTRASQKAVTVDSESEEENIVLRSGPPRLIDDDSDEDEDDMPTTMGTQRGRGKRKRAPSVDSFVASSPPSIVSDDDVEVVEKPRRRRAEDSNEEDEESETEPVTPRRRLKRRRQMSRQEEEDLAEDLDFLEPSSDVESARKPRSSQSAKKTAHQKALEKLKRQRSGQPTEPDIAEENEEESESDEQEAGDEDDSDDDVVEVAPVSSRQMFAADEDDEDFIEEEDVNNPLGVPDGIPLEFTRYGSMKTKELFKFAVEWMVQKKINPAFARDDEIYHLTFKKLNDEVTGLAGSKFTSSAWTPDFTIALKSRPEVAIEPLDRTQPEHFMRDHCDACNRSGHPATYQMQFLGTPYHPNTLEEVDGDEDDDDDEDTSSESAAAPGTARPSRNHQGREIPPSTRRFFVGKFCKANAETAHSLHHWRLHLYQIVEAYLISRGYNTSARLVERDGWSTRKRRKYANKIVDRMASEGEVRELWKKFRENTNQARDAKLDGRFGR